MSQIYPLLIQKINSKEALIEEWFSKKFSEHKPLFYNSVDLRHSNFKIAPVDTNCFPAGFNNLSQNSVQNAKKIADQFFTANFPAAQKILIIPENHTRNFRYLENILELAEIIKNNGKREVVVGTLIAEVEESLEIDLENGKKITLQKIVRKDQEILTKNNFQSDLIILNNDLTNGIPEVLLNPLQPIIPSINLGWHTRRKSTHFGIYNQLAAEFAKIIDIDPWFISTFNDECEDIDFKEQKGTKCISFTVDNLIARLKEKYQQYKIGAEAYCYVKADKGTYGMGMMNVKSSAEILEINKKERNKMNTIKGSVQSTQVIIQEGVETIDKVKNMIAEPMIYLMNGTVVGNLFRVNDQRDNKENLNAAGMSFYDISNLEDEDLSLGLPKNEVIKIYSVIARLAALASAIEKY